MIQIRIENHTEVARTQGGLLGRIGLGLGKVGLLDIKSQVEEKIAKMVREELQQKGVLAEVVVVDVEESRSTS
jgi:hypothetical protein